MNGNIILLQNYFTLQTVCKTAVKKLKYLCCTELNNLMKEYLKVVFTLTISGHYSVPGCDHAINERPLAVQPIVRCY